MNIKGGALEFDILANNKQINSALDETTRRVQGFSKATVDGNKTIDDVFGVTTENIRIQKGVIADLESQIKRLDKEISKLAPGRPQAQLMADARATRQELDNEREGLKLLESAVEKNNQAHVSFRTQLRNLREEMVAMEAAGKRNTDEYRTMQTEAGRLTDAIGDVRQQAAILAHDQSGFQGVISAVSGITGGFSAAQGAIGLFAGENENLQKIMLKVQSLMAITIGLQQVSATLNKDSAFQLIVVAKAKTMLATATNGLSVALGISNIAAKALMATLTLGLSAAIGAVIYLWDKFSSKAKEAKKAQEEFNKAVAEAAFKPVAAIEELSHKWNKLGDNLKAKEKFIEENSEKFKELGASVRSVADADNLLIKNKAAFIQSEIEKAKAMTVRAQAAGLLKEAIENQRKLEDVKKSTPTVIKSVAEGQYGETTVYKRVEIANPLIAKLEGEGKAINAKIAALYDEATNYEIEGVNALNDAGIKGAISYEKGTIGYWEQAIAKEAAALKTISDPTKYAVSLKNIENFQAEVDKITKGKTHGSSRMSSPTKKTDPFVEMLENRKKEYDRFLSWINSGDEVLRNSAKTEFAGLLNEGSSYLEFLTKQRDKLLEETKGKNPNATQKKDLTNLSNEIASATKTTALGEYELSLNKQLTAADSILAKLKVIDDLRKANEGDKTEVGTGTNELLQKAQEGIAKQAEAETKALLDNYAGYLSEKINFELQYGEKKRLLTEQLAKTTTDAERQIATEALRGLEEDRKKYAESSGNSQYDELLNQYKTFEQKCSEINADFEEKRRLAKEQGNNELIQRLNEAEQKALSKVATEQLTSSSAWENLFGNLDELTATQIDTLINEIESKFSQLSVQFDPVDLETVRKKLNDARQILIADNPFKQIGVAIKEIFNDGAAESKVSANKIKSNWKNLASATEGSFKFVQDAIGSAEFLKDAIGDVGATAISSMETVAMVSISVAIAIKTAEKSSVILTIIQAALVVVQAVLNVVKSIVAANDKRIAKEIGRHKEAVEALESAYKDLERAIGKALGNDTYKYQKQSINNLREQQKELLEMQRLEREKKKTDHGKIKEYEEAYKEAGSRIEDTIAEIANSITQTTAKDLANELADAIVEAFGKGEDAALAFEEVSKKVMQNAVKNALKLQFLEKPLQKAIDQLQKDMGFDEEGNGSFDGLTPEEQQRFKDEIAKIGKDYDEAMKLVEDLFKDIGDAETDPATTLSGALKTASQESINLLAGQTNAVRINQVESIDLLRRQLMHLANIDGRIGTSNSLLKRIESNTSKRDYDPLRAQGLNI